MLNAIKKFFFNDVSSILEIARKRILVEADMLHLPAHIDPKNPHLNLAELNFKSEWKLLFSTIIYTRRDIFKGYFWYFISTLLSLVSPLFIHKFLSLINSGQNVVNFHLILIYGVLLALCGLLSGIFVQHFFSNALASFQQITNIFNELIFKKSLKLNQFGRANNMVGDIVNFMGTDAESVSDFCFVIADLVMNAILVIGAVVMLFYYIGLSAISALVVMILMIPLTKKIANQFIGYEEEMMSLRDKRVSMMGQILNSIRVVKYFAFEDSVIDEVMKIRNSELTSRKKLARAQVISGVNYVMTTTIVLFVALFTHSLRGYSLDAALIFTCVSLFGVLEGPLGELSHHLSRMTNAFVGAKRIIKFLNEEEIKDNNFIESEDIKFENVTFHYPMDRLNGLKDINFEIKKGEKVAIVGEVGAFKSTLLSIILNELPIEKGSISFPLSKKISYLPQEAFIINATLKENIILGESFDEQRFNDALIKSALIFDINQFNARELTEIGEKGVNLSGGQKQRVGLARAYYHQPDVILLDDPLSAVDVKTENYLMANLFLEGFKDKTLIAVTHRLGHLKTFDKIMFLKKGKIVCFGNFLDVLKNHEFQSFYRNHADDEQVEANEELKSENKKNHDKNNTRITSDEDREIGAVKKDVYFDYFMSLGGDDEAKRKFNHALLMIGAIVIAFLPLLQKSWLSYYTNHQHHFTPVNGILIYGIIGIVVVLISMANSFLWLDRGIKASQILHDKMLNSVMAAPISFFDSTPVGRVLQRFSRDVESVDVYLQWSFISVINCILQVFVSILLIVTIMPILFLFIAPLLCVYYFYQLDYRRAAREAKRFDSIGRSPRYAHFKETLMGLPVIRAFKKENYFIDEFFKKLKFSQQMFYSHYMLNRWFSSRIPIIGGLISLIATIGISYYSRYGGITAGVAGLVTIYSLSFWSYLNWGVRVFSDIESRMTSVERIKFFSNIKPEENDQNKNVIDLDHWPSRGEIHAIDIKARYASHMPLVLKGINFHIKAGTKVGIVGRTGSGKSTIFQCLFRFIELESGEILIDGINIKNIPLKKLRRAMAIIPQDPTLFMGTIRSNLDRYQKFNNDEIERVLKLTGLYPFIQNLPKQLETEVNETGSNLSQGQRQLLCLARALLYKTKIIVMDEATASVDVMTDNLIQKVIREDLVNTTLVIIAHRLSTIKDCDQVIEISNGLIK